MTANTRIEIRGADEYRFDEILTPDALAFVARLHDRMARRIAVENGRDLGFLPETASVRHDTQWKVAGAGPGLEDATSSTWSNIIAGQLTLFDAVRRELDFPAYAHYLVDELIPVPA